MVKINRFRIKFKNNLLYLHIKYFIANLVNNIILLLSHLIETNKKMILIGGWFGERFADNSKAVYLYLVENKEKFGLQEVNYIVEDQSIYNELRARNYPVLKNIRSNRYIII